MNNPFIQAFAESDFLGRLIFIGLYALSVCCWSIIIYKGIILVASKRLSSKFSDTFQRQKSSPLQIEYLPNKGENNPFYQLYLVLKRQTVDILNKNHRFGEKEGRQQTYLVGSDIDGIASHLQSQISLEIQALEHYLFLLATIVGLAPLLGLLGTVWGILTTFSDMQGQMGGGSNQMILSGLSLALTTTVLGLIDAIPALIAYNYFKNRIRSFAAEMENFSNEILTSVELQYRKVS